MTNGHAPTNTGPDMASNDVEKMVAIPKIGKVKVITHLVTILNIASSFCRSPRLYSSAIVGANMALNETCGITIKALILTAAAYRPNATFEIAKYASSMVSIDCSNVSMIEVKKFGAAKPNHSRSSYISERSFATLLTLRKKKKKLSEVAMIALITVAIMIAFKLWKSSKATNSMMINRPGIKMR